MDIIKRGNYDEVKQYITEEDIVNERDEDGNTPLTVVSFRGYYDITKLLIDYGADPHMEDKRGFLPVTYATENMHHHVAKLLKSHMYCRDNLIYYSKKGIYDEVENILNEDIDFRENEAGPFSLVVASRYGHHRIVKSLLNYGISPNSIPSVIYDGLEDLFLKSPLLGASRYNHYHVVELLLKAGADPNIPLPYENDDVEGFPLVAAACSGHHESAKLLLRWGADPNVEADEGSPLMAASRNGHYHVVKLLLEYTTNITSDMLMEAVRRGHKDTSKLLLDKGIDVNTKDRYGNTLLLMCIKDGNKEMVVFLLMNGADPNIPDRYGNTPFTFAPMKGYGYLHHLLKNTI